MRIYPTEAALHYGAPLLFYPLFNLRLRYRTLPVPMQPVHMLMPEPLQMGQSAPVPPRYRSKIIQSRDLCMGIPAL